MRHCHRTYALRKDRKNDKEREVEETVEEKENRIVAELAKFGTIQEPEDDENIWHSVRLPGEGGPLTGAQYFGRKSTRT
jgi:hypothetical protein